MSYAQSSVASPQSSVVPEALVATGRISSAQATGRTTLAAE